VELGDKNECNQADCCDFGLIDGFSLSINDKRENRVEK
jgi:hypothetical protein